MLGSAVGVADVDAGGVGRDGKYLRVRRQGGPARARGALERRRDRAHTADWHQPVTRAVADHVIEQAAVLAQVVVVGPGEGADQRVGQYDAGDDVVTEHRADRGADRL